MYKNETWLLCFYFYQVMKSYIMKKKYPKQYERNTRWCIQTDNKDHCMHICRDNNYAKTYVLVSIAHPEQYEIDTELTELWCNDNRVMIIRIISIFQTIQSTQIYQNHYKKK